MKLFKLEKPNLDALDKAAILKKYTENTSDMFKYIFDVSEPEYLYWDKVKYKQTPPGLTHEEFWYLVKQIRKLSWRPTIIKAEDENFFSWLRLTYTDEYLHKIDMHTGGRLFATHEEIKDENKQKFLARGILEEAIASSQLEGASTTRKAAKLMILENKVPKDKSEKMILNNYQTMQQLDRDYKNKELSRELLFEIHAMLTKDTVDKNEQYRFRKDSDEIVVHNDKFIAHIPPKEDFLKKEIDRLIDFANDKDSHIFTHPVIKAIFLHFWVGYLHPFTDGNGRLARALFYWYLLRKDYWTFIYLPISSIIKGSPAQYANAYIYSEQDDYDLTYFFDYHIRKILKSIDEFNLYVNKITSENKQIDLMLGKEVSLNERQKQLIHYLLSETAERYVTVKSHMALNNISRRTAYSDLKYLHDKNLLITQRQGKFVRYLVSNNLKEKNVKQA